MCNDRRVLGWDLEKSIPTAQPRCLPLLRKLDLDILDPSSIADDERSLQLNHTVVFSKSLSSENSPCPLKKSVTRY